MESFALRLKTRRLRLGLTQKEVADLAGIALRSIIYWEKGNGTPQSAKVQQLAKALQTTTNWLLGKEPTMEEMTGVPEFSKSLGMTQSEPITTYGTKAPKGFCPVVSWARAGEDGFNYPDLADHLDELVECDSRDPNAFALIIEGDSMEPRFLAGDRVIISPNSEPRNGDFVIARLQESGGVLFKRFKQTGSEGQTVVLESLNELYKPKEYPRKEFRFVYPVVGMVAKFRR